MIDEAIALARGELRANRPANAVPILLNAAAQTHVQQRDYDELLRTLAQTLQLTGMLRAAATVWLYLRDPARAAQLSNNEARDLGRAALLADNPALAAQHYRAAHWPAHAAIAFERAKLFPEARALWEEVSADPRLREDPYTAALVSFNLGRVLNALGDSPTALRCRVRATRLLEEAADMLEARGLRERAFDCFQVLLTLGAELGSFENLAEGYLNCIRILREDHLKYYALQYYEDFIARADKAQEFHASATILHEASDYSRGLGLPFHTRLREREAEAWRRAAGHHLTHGTAVEFAENALLAAVGAFSAAGLHGRAVKVFRELATLPGIETKRAQRYDTLSKRYAEARDENNNSGALPDFLRAPVAYPDIWNVDVIEWEEAGDAVETCGEILIDASIADFVRRKAMLARLTVLTSPEPHHPTTLARLAESLGQVQLYGVLAPLESLFDRGGTEVRTACLRAARTLFFKRTFTLIFRAVIDDDPAVRQAAIDTITQLHFVHAFDPLQRLHRDSTDRNVRAAALGSIGRITSSREAVEYLLGVFIHGSEDERQQAQELLFRSDSAETTEVLRDAMAHESPEVAQTLMSVLRRRSR